MLARIVDEGKERGRRRGGATVEGSEAKIEIREYFERGFLLDLEPCYQSYGCVYFVTIYC